MEGHGSYLRLDFFCISKNEMHRAAECCIEPLTFSDQVPVVLKLNLGQHKQFKYWRLNVSILNDLIHKQEIQREWVDYIKINDNGMCCGMQLKP